MLPPCSNSIERAYQSLSAVVATATGLVVKLEAQRVAGALSNDEAALLYEACFLQVFCEFETYLETTILDFMTGSCCKNGTRPNRYVHPTDRDHARDFYLEGKQFAQFSDTPWVRKVCERIFENGFPFVAALNSSGRLPALRDVRNRIAHQSEYSHTKFLAVVRTEFTVIPPYIFRPGDLLMSTEPRGRWPKQFFIRYVEDIRSVALKIYEG